MATPLPPLNFNHKGKTCPRNIESADINKISHDSAFNPNSIKVSQVYNKVMELKKLGKIF